MDQINYGNIRLGIADAGTQMLSALKNASQGLGFRDVKASQDLKLIEDALATNSLDLVICDAELGEGESDSHSLVKSVRRGELGDNPFVKFMFVLSSSNTDFVRKLIDCGADDMLVKPISPSILSKRINHLTNSRKPFVVTYDYIGPDRRANSRSEANDIEKIEVPNALQLKTRADFRQHLLTKQITQAKEKINVRIVECQACQISYQADKALVFINSGEDTLGNKSAKTHLDQLIEGAKNLVPLLENTAYAQEDIIVNTISDVAKRILSDPKPKSNDVDQLNKISKLVRKSFASSQQVAA